MFVTTKTGFEGKTYDHQKQVDDAIDKCNAMAQRDRDLVCQIELLMAEHDALHFGEPRRAPTLEAIMSLTQTHQDACVFLIQTLDDLIESCQADGGLTSRVKQLTRTRAEVDELARVIPAESVKGGFAFAEQAHDENDLEIPVEKTSAKVRIGRGDAKIAVKHHPFERTPYLTLSKDTTWKFARSFGESAEAAALWVELDSEDRIVRRVVRKDTSLSARGMAHPARWKGDPNSSDKVPIECHCHGKVQSRPGAEGYVVEALKWELDLIRQQYRLYTAYCPYGDLATLIQRHKGRRRPVPGTFCWMVFSALVNCGLLMNEGSLTGEIVEGWQQIVHRDLKPDKIFLDLADEGHGFPGVKLGDFGHALDTSELDNNYPTLWSLGDGTPGYIAPEHMNFNNPAVLQPENAFKLLAHTNVWGVGAIMLCLVTRTCIRSHVQPSCTPHIGLDHRGRYTYAPIHKDVRDSSPKLCELIERCIRVEPEERPPFTELQQEIQAYIDREEPIPGSMRNAMNGAQLHDGPAASLFVPSEEYKMGMALGSS